MVDPQGSLEAEFTFEGERGRQVDEPPFGILVLGDWSAAAEKLPLSQRRPIEIDRDNFDEVMSRLGSRLVLDLATSPSTSLTFRSLDDFHPDGIFQQQPLFQQLRELRRDLLSPGKFADAATKVRAWFDVDVSNRGPEARPAGDISSTEGLLDSILSGTNAPASSVKSFNDPELSSFVRDIVRPHLVSIDDNEQAALLAAIDAATSDIMRRVLHDRDFQALEAAWRGLYLLVRRADTASDLKIYILDVSKDELRYELQSVSKLADSRLFDIAVNETVETPGADRWSVFAGNYGFLPNKDDIATLIRVAKIAAAAGAPFISHIRPEVIGIASLSSNRDPADWDLRGESDAGKLWSVLRGIPESVYLGMTIPRFLARVPYGRDTEPLETFQFEEFSREPEHDDYLWSNCCFLAALLLAQSYSEHGWEMDRRFVQDIENLPIHTYESNGESVFQPCGEVLLTEKACERLMEYGIMPLASNKNSDRVRLARFQSISQPVTALRGRWTE
jgi:type VI secretion system protein ImpC